MYRQNNYSTPNLRSAPVKDHSPLTYSRNIQRFYGLDTPINQARNINSGVKLTPIARRGLGNPMPEMDITAKPNTFSPPRSRLNDYFGKKIPRSGFFNPLTGETKNYCNPRASQQSNVSYPRPQFMNQLTGAPRRIRADSVDYIRPLFANKVIFKGAGWKDTSGILG